MALCEWFPIYSYRWFLFRSFLIMHSGRFRNWEKISKCLKISPWIPWINTKKYLWYYNMVGLVIDLLAFGAVVYYSCSIQPMGEQVKIKTKARGHSSQVEGDTSYRCFHAVYIVHGVENWSWITVYWPFIDIGMNQHWIGINSALIHHHWFSWFVKNITAIYSRILLVWIPHR